jgi:hypothetical protein
MFGLTPKSASSPKRVRISQPRSCAAVAFSRVSLAAIFPIVGLNIASTLRAIPDVN